MTDAIAEAAAYLIDRLYKVTKGVPVRDLDEAWVAYNSALASRPSAIVEPMAVADGAPDDLDGVMDFYQNYADDLFSILSRTSPEKRTEMSRLLVAQAIMRDRKLRPSPQPHTGKAGVTAEIDAIIEVSTKMAKRMGLEFVPNPEKIAALNAALTVEPEAPDNAFAEYEGVPAKELAETVARYGKALKEISSPTQTEGLLWWQIKAREALAGVEPEAGEPFAQIADQAALNPPSGWPHDENRDREIGWEAAAKFIAARIRSAIAP